MINMCHLGVPNESTSIWGFTWVIPWLILAKCYKNATWGFILAARQFIKASERSDWPL